MGKYGQAAVDAVESFWSGLDKSPRGAWSRAVACLFPKSPSSRDKGCPMYAFLGLCEEGLVKGIPPGDYTESVKNKQYAVDAVRLLRLDPALAGDKMLLWQRVLGKRTIIHNDQMDVVASLWERGLLT